MPVTQVDRPKGARRGPPPYGWQWIGGQLVPLPSEQHVRWLIRHLHRECGWSLAAVVRFLADIGVRNRQGMSWHTATLHRVVRGPDLEDPG